MAADHVLAIDQGTTSTRAVLFDAQGEPVASAQRELAQSFPRDGWVEHDAAEIWTAARELCVEALAGARLDAARVAAIGLTNQRETIVLWERGSGRPLHPAIVWQDRRTARDCEALRAAGHEALVQRRTGLLLDPYFSATKLAWLLEHVPGARARAERGELAAGTIDCWLLWNLTGGARHATDASNASRTALFDVHRQCWDDELLALFGVPRALLPEVLDNAADFGRTPRALFGRELPVTGLVGDQQGAALGQACWEAGTIKATYGTGGFVLLNTGERAPVSRHRLLGTVGYRLGGSVSHALEGSLFSAGSTMQWLRDGLGLFGKSAESEALARRADPQRRVALVPAFTGLGAPHWDPRARGAILGLTRDATAADLVAAGLQAVAFQTRELLDAMAADGAPAPAALRVDGGLSNNGYAMQFLADMLALPVERPEQTETTVLGAALLAGLHVGLYPAPRALAERWRLDRRFEPTMSADERADRWSHWQAAVARVTERDA